MGYGTYGFLLCILYTATHSNEQSHLSLSQAGNTNKANEAVYLSCSTLNTFECVFAWRPGRHFDVLSNTFCPSEAWGNRSGAGSKARSGAGFRRFQSEDSQRAKSARHPWTMRKSKGRHWLLRPPLKESYLKKTFPYFIRLYSSHSFYFLYSLVLFCPFWWKRTMTSVRKHQRGLQVCSGKRGICMHLWSFVVRESHILFRVQVDLPQFFERLALKTQSIAWKALFRTEIVQR